MNNFKSINLLVICIFSLVLVNCKTKSLEYSAPFEIVEKSYFYWVGGKQGTQGTSIRIEGVTTSLNISFSKLFFQNREYDIVPQFTSRGFIIEGNFSEFRDNQLVMDKDPAAEYGNQADNATNEFPFDLKEDEAILLYSVNGREGYHKITDLKQLEKVYRP